MAKQIIYDAENHLYSLKEIGKDPVQIPGVTSLLAEGGLGFKGQANQAAMDFGTVGHTIIRMLNNDELGEYDPAFEPWMLGVEQFRSDCSLNDWICNDDRIVYSEKYQYAGRPDYIGRATVKQMGRDEGFYLLDWKFWATATPGAIDDAELQCEAYARAGMEMGIYEYYPKKAVVHFFPGQYRIIPLTDPAAWTVFLSCLNIKRWKERHKC